MSDETTPGVALPRGSDLFARPPYRTGDGEVVVPPRPGAQDALDVPSRFGDELRYRDGRVVRA